MQGAVELNFRNMSIATPSIGKYRGTEVKLGTATLKAKRFMITCWITEPKGKGLMHGTTMLHLVPIKKEERI